MPRLLAIVLLCGCGGPAPSDTDPPVPAPTSEPFVPSIPAGGCGLPPYDWLPADAVGTIVSRERAPELDLSAATLAVTLELAEVEGLEPVYDVEIHRVRYLTQDRGEPVETTALVALPDRDGPLSTAAWLHPIAGFDDFCAPSGLGLEGAIGPALLASLGFAAVAPDYLGLNGHGDPDPELHPFMVPEAGAVASLDGVRALWRLLDEEGVDHDREVVLWGASEGGFHAAWAHRYAPHYAPELDVVAAVAAVPPTDLWGLARHGASTFGPTTEGLAAAIVTTHRWYRGQAPLDEALAPAVAAALEPAMAEECDPDLGAASVDEVLASDFAAALVAGDPDGSAPWSCYFQRAVLADSEIPLASDAPLLVVVGALDDLVAAEVGRADFPRLCEAGYAAEYVECADADHVEGAAWSLPYQWRWVQDRLAGAPLGPCAPTDPVDCTAL